MNGLINRYMTLTHEELNEKLEQNNKILSKIWEEDDGSSWDNYCKKCQPYWDDNRLLHVAASMNTTPDKIEMRSMDEWHKKCRVPI